MIRIGRSSARSLASSSAVVCCLSALLAGCSGTIDGSEFAPDDTGLEGGGSDAQLDGAGDDTTAPPDGDVDSGAPDDSGETDSGAPTDSGATDSGATDSGATDSGATDSGATDSGATDSGVTDSGATDSGVTDTGTVDGGVVCGALAADWTEAFVDRSSKLPSVGTKACPFHTILEGTSLATSGPTKARTIYVKGGTAAAPFVYAELAPLDVKPGVVLQGEAAATTKITEGAAGCPKAPGAATNFHCAVFVQAGGTARQLTVTSTGGVGVVTDSGGGLALPVVTLVDATGCKQDGVMTLGGAQIGPAVHLNANSRHGLNLIGASGAVSVPGGDAANSFDANGADGVHAEGSGISLSMSQGSASNNGGTGVALQSGGASGSGIVKHSVDKLVAKGNKGNGVAVGRFTTLTLRSSTLLSNGNHGLLFSQGTANSLDVGAPGGAGANVAFSGASSASRNGKSGLCIDNAGANGSQPAVGDVWGACPPPQVKITQCGAVTTYAEINFSTTNAATTSPVAIGGCSVGP